MMRGLIPTICLLLVGCSGSSPTRPTPTPAPTPPQPQGYSGRIVDTMTGQPVQGATALHLGAADPRQAGRWLFAAPGYISRETTGREVVDLIPEAGFDLGFYQAFARNAFETSGMQPLRRQSGAPMVYIRTVDEAGATIPPATVEMVASSLRDVAPLWTGGRFGLAGVERGTETRDGLSGWITVHWLAPDGGNFCGQAPIGGTRIDLNYLKTTGCGCQGWPVAPRTVKHELGHAMGFYHTGDAQDLMVGLSIPRTCDAMPSPRERHHAAIVYARPIGNQNVDVDPRTPATQGALVVVD